MKKNGAMWAIAVAMAMTAATGNAQTRSGFSAGVELLNYRYRETFAGDGTAKYNGGFWGFSTAYTKAFANKNFLRANLGFDFGSTDYRADDGTRVDDINQGFAKLELHFGRDFRLRNGATLSPFIGAGWRVLIDNSGGHTANNGSVGYDTTTGYRYVPSGVAATLPLRGATLLTLAGQYNWVVGGDVENDFSSIDPSAKKVKMDLESGSGYELSAMINMPVRSRTLSVGPFVSGWHVGESKTATIKDPRGSGATIELMQPPARTTKAGVRVSFAF